VIYRTLVRPVVICGAARWSLTATDENAPRSFEGRILRKIVGPVWDRSERKMLEGHDIVRFVKAKSISWLEPVEEMSEKGMPKGMLKRLFSRRRTG